MSSPENAPQPLPRLKVQGLPRVGTNYLQRLLATNFNAHSLAAEEDGWKHGPCECRDDIQYLFVTKNPYSWIISFWHWEIIHKRTESERLSAFIAGPVTHPRLESTWRASSPVDAWNLATRSWLGHRGDTNALLLRYEDLIADYGSTLEIIETQFGLERRQPRWIEYSARADDWATPIPRRPLDVAYYRNERFLAEFSQDSRSLMRAGLDPELMFALGYQWHP